MGWCSCAGLEIQMWGFFPLVLGLFKALAQGCVRPHHDPDLRQGLWNSGVTNLTLNHKSHGTGIEKNRNKWTI